MSNPVENILLKVKNDEILVNNKTFYLRTKRWLDIFGALTGILIFGFVFLIIALAIKIEDPKGPLFFKQKRVGLNGKEFIMYKFRSMVSNAEEKLNDLLKYNDVSGHMFKMKNDPRVTKVGRFIRKTSLDELPQLINVLKGDMSLVGPRPPLPREVEQYSKYELQRLYVIPGCTGLWQVSGRSNIGFKEMVELDLYYIRTRSIMVDLKIIIFTVFVLFGSKNAF
ncbi:sugar transferase [Bacillus sp. B15-48]|uniref:sugar transferase n=1 Tax=Bacillus sp. B15-48 TaxID=1548601 RepID=UPI00193FD727|nr:sugar transferase [Bacillus sp. B15-48]MBM4764477.1 sugar transferase [Bacillus sp. B15-48]